MCPSISPGLADAYGDDFETLYWGYVSSGKYIEKIKASELLVKITKSLAESGVPYILFKDHINKKSNQKNIGTIKSSNLCSEITQVSDHTSYAVCNLASIAVNQFLDENGIYNYEHLRSIAYEVTINLNNIIDLNYYPTPESEKSNLSTRPIGIGIQGMGDLLLLLRIPYESDQALDIESKVMETIYYGSLQASIDLSKKYGPYDRFIDSPFSKGKFQFDLDYTLNRELMWDWTTLRTNMLQWGTRNSLLTSLKRITGW
jgi:ribonucleotide reductase alpha subunit